MNLANLNMGGNPLASPNAAHLQMLAVAQAQAQISQAAQAAQTAQAAQAAQLGGYGYPSGQSTLSAPRANRIPSGRRSPMLGGGHGHPGKSPSPVPMAQGQGGGAGGGAGVAGPDDVDIKILDDVSSWLRVLRLHKYTTNFEHSNWRDMVQMTDQDLQDKGVAAQGARSKFLKVSGSRRDTERGKEGFHLAAAHHQIQLDTDNCLGLLQRPHHRRLAAPAWIGAVGPRCRRQGQGGQVNGHCPPGCRLKTLKLDFCLEMTLYPFDDDITE